MRKVFSVLAAFALAIPAVWAQDDESGVKWGVELMTELNFGNVAGEDYAFIGNGKAVEYKPGQARWMLPRVTFTGAKGKFDFEGRMEATLVDGTNPPEKVGLWTLTNTYAQFRYTISDPLKIWIMLGDGSAFRPGISYGLLENALTLSLQIPVLGDGGGFGYNLLKPYIYLKPKVEFAKNGFDIYAEFELQPLNHFAYVKDKLDDDGWQKYKTGDNDYFVSTVEIQANYTLNALYFELTGNIPLYKDGVKKQGIKITPLVQYAILNNLKAYVKAEIDEIGNDVKADISFAPAIGLKFNF
ncbi:MAG: hypothetical protein LBG74_02600 [Spirochaetaceae bacterium]|jgi:hypothetical protein|nr:hypothetical protein [Spirochaetaceae bacterium]